MSDRRWIRRIAITGVGLLLGACMTEDPRSGSRTPAKDAGASVTVKVFLFQPSPLDIEAGEIVTWTNEDDIEHTVTSGEPGSPDDGFDGPLDGVDATFRHAFERSGTFAYFCAIHESMRGVVRVSG